MPIGGYKYSPINYGGTNTIGTGAASFVYRLSEIETRIEKQMWQLASFQVFLVFVV